MSQTETRNDAKNEKASSASLAEVQHRAEAAEKQVEELKRTVESLKDEHRSLKEEISEAPRNTEDESRAQTRGDEVDVLRSDSMMAHLLDSLEGGKDIGHYGRLVFAMVARHFLSDDAVIEWLRKDRDFSAEAAIAMLRQVEGRDYNPPRRDRILAWQKEQEFPIIPSPEDPDCGNIYKSLKFPQEVYEHIQEYQEEKVLAER